MNGEVREIAAIVPMPRLLESLGFQVKERTRRGPCVIPSHAHGGSNPSVFSWREDGHWYCFSRSVGGDRIALVRAVRECSFREALAFLAALAGIDYRQQKISRADLQRSERRRERASRAAWHIRDEVLRLRSHYGEALRRTERLQRRIGIEDGTEVWDRLARLASVSTFFLAAFTHISNLDSAGLAHFALTSATERRAEILGSEDEYIVQAV